MGSVSSSQFGIQQVKNGSGPSQAAITEGPMALYLVRQPFISPSLILQLDQNPISLYAVYDVTRRDTFDNLDRIWMKEVDIYSNIEDAVKMVVANKVDLVSRPYREHKCASLCLQMQIGCSSAGLMGRFLRDS
jgi:GTPase SAR1 family protein